MENHDNKKEELDPSSPGVVNALLLIAIENIVDSRAYLFTIMDELARQNSVKNGTTFEEEKGKLDKEYEGNKKGGHARFAQQVKDKIPALKSLMDEYLEDLI